MLKIEKESQIKRISWVHDKCPCTLNHMVLRQFLVIFADHQI